MSKPLSQIRARMHDGLSSIRRRAAVRWWYKVGFGFLSICMIGAAKVDSLSEARGAVRHYMTRARTAFLMTDPDTAVFFGPKQFVTVKSNTQVNFVESFSIPPLGGGSVDDSTGEVEWAPAPNAYTIRLQRVGGSLTTATVAVNGTQVATIADFASTTYIERSIPVNQVDYYTNSFTVALKGAAGAGLIATIVGVPNATFDIFGPKVYTKAAATPTNFVENFAVPTGASAPYAISATASVAGTKATITLNGVQVIKDTDFGTNVTYVSKPVALLSGNNAMQVDVRGNTGTTITLSVTATDKTAPTLAIAAPPPGFVTNASTVTVTGTSQDRTPTQVKVNGVVATMTGPLGMQFSATVPLNPGVNSVAIRATDMAGNHTDSSRTVTRDTLAPTLTVTSPTDGSFTTQDAVTVAGTVSDATAVTVKVNGVSYPVDQGGAFTGSYQLAPGANFLTIEATDAPGNVTSQVIKVTQDRTLPTLTVTAPSDGSYTNATSINVTGTASDAGTVSVTVNGSPVTLNPDGTFSHSLTLVSGTNAISVIATDGAANSTAVSRTVTQDREAPVSTLSIPILDANDPFTNADTAVVIVTATDASPVIVTLDGSPLSVDANGKYIGSVPLVEGWNGFLIEVADVAGNRGFGLGVAILRDTQSPVINLTSPAEGAHFDTGPIVVSGSIQDSNEAKNFFSVLVNGVEACPSTEYDPNDPPPPGDPELPSCNFSTQVNLVPGSNTISIVAKDATGNTSTLTRTVTFGASEPLPPDPATVAPTLDPTVATTTFAATAFLYTGPTPIQTGVVAGTIQPLQAAVIRGTVRARTGAGLPGVKVTVLDHPEFGQTLSRADGAFDLVVNGGEPITLNYQKTGFLPAQRQVSALWQDYAVVESVTLVGLDPQVTTVNFSQPAQAAQGAVVTDESGTRQATMIFKGGTQASLKMPDGTIQPVASIAVRATEYTVGPTGPSAMPAPLPATSAYTYAVELSADEAIAAGATSVLFDRPVAVYVDNFLNFPVGGLVPVGIYDRSASQWVPSPDGRIVKVLQVANDRASLDVDGAGSEATPEALAAIGVDEAELTKLAALYAPGKSFWRVQLSHFSPIDLNWPQDSTSEPPKRPNPDKNNAQKKDCKTAGSIIGCERQTLGESLAIAGTSLRLNYQSDGSRGYKEAYSTEISLIGDTVPQNLLRIVLEIRIAGRLFTETFSAQPNQNTQFVWDGNDAYGRPVQGPQLARIRIGYTYPAQNYAAVIYRNLSGSFGSYPSSALTGDRARSEATMWQDMNLMLGTRDTRAEGLGGWSIDVHHYYDALGKIVHLGDGSQRSAADLANAATTIAGTDPVAPGCPSDCANKAKSGDRAVDAFFSIQGIGVARDGTMYVADLKHFKIWRVNTAGILEHVAGTGTNEFSGDNIPAISASIGPASLQVGPDNSVYFTDLSGPAGSRIRRIDKDGIITTVAGTGVCGDSLPAGTLANQANLCFSEFFVAKDGAVFVTDRTEVFRVGTDGILTRIVGDGSYVRCPSGTRSYTCAEGKPANAHGAFHRLDGIAVGDDGSLYLANREFRVLRGMVIYRIGPDGIIRRFAGNGDDCCTLVDGTPAMNTPIVSRETQLRIAGDGTLYFTEDFGLVSRIDQSGRLRFVAGCIGPAPVSCGRNSGRRATNTTLAFPSILGALAFGPDGRLYFADDYIARRVDAPLPALGINLSTVASEDGSQLFVFAPDGKHLRTLDALLGHTVYEFAYDAAGLLSTITDGDGNVVVVEHDGTGALTAIVAPFGQRTEVTLNPAKYLATVTRPGEPATVLTYSPDGLLKTFKDGNGNLHQFTYDDNGLLVRDDDPAGGFKTLVRSVTDSSSAVTVTTALGNSITHGTTNTSVGSTRRTTVDGAGLASTVVTGTNGSVTLTGADGTITRVSTGPDARFGMQAPVLSQMTTRTPSGLLATVTAGERTVLSDPANPLSLTTQLDSVVVNGRLFRRTYVAATRTSTAVTPTGRSTTTRFDSLGHVIEEATPDVLPLQYQYDGMGRLAQMAQGSRQWGYSYDTQGRIANSTDPRGRSYQYFYDVGGRLTRQLLTDGREVLYSYYPNGELRSVTPAGRPPHQFQHNSVGLLTAYEPPSLGLGTWSTTYQYDLDRRLTQVMRPDGQIIAFGYDAAGRPSTLTVPGGAVQYSYSSTTGSLTSVSGPYGGSLAFSYDGALLTGATWAGEVAGAVTATYNNDFQVTGLSVNGATPVGFAYDGDGLLRQAGNLTINRSPANGVITGTALGAITTSRSYTPLGELGHHTASINGSALFDVSYTLDTLGRISELTETVAGVTSTKGYSYDLAGRLTEVSENATLTAVYEYDANGNRLRATRPSGLEIAAYDDQDRLLSYGTASYAYTRNGELSTKTVGSEVTRYNYDVLGNLQRITLPNDTVIEYVIDGMNRRVGKKVNGVLLQGWLYQNQLNPVAELDGAGNIVSQFVYGSRLDVPDYIVKSGATYQLVSDHLGSVRLVVDIATGAVVQRIDYDEWGKVTQNTNPAFQPFGYAGGLFDTPTDLVKLGARVYDATTGRWLTKDPLGLAAGGANLYSYSFSDPINLVDQDGQLPVPLIVAAPIVGGLVNGAFAAIQAGRCGMSVLEAFGRGFVGGAAGTLAGIVALEAGAGAAVIGGTAAFAGWLAENLLPGGNLDPVAGTVQTGAGFVGGPLVARLPGLRIKPGTFEPNLYKPRSLSDYGKNSRKGLGQEAVVGAVVGGASLTVPGCGCQ